MEKFENEVEKLNEDPVFTHWISAEEDARKVTNTLISNAKKDGIKQGITKGITKGITNEKINIAKKMLKDNLNIEDIITYTELSKEDIQNIKKEITD